MVRRRPTPPIGERPDDRPDDRRREPRVHSAPRGRASESRLPRVTIYCPDCDVTWRGSVHDACWSCGTMGQAERATAPQVRVS